MSELNVVTDEPAETLLPHFDFFDATHADRAPDVLAHARATCPVSHTTATDGYYIASTYDIVSQVLRDPETFSSDGYINIAGNGGIAIPPIDADPPMHHEYRKLLNPFFHPNYIAQRDATTREIARGHIDQWAKAGQCEFVGDFAGPFVTDVLAKVVFEADDPELFRKAAVCNDRISEGDLTAYPEFGQLITTFVDQHDGSGNGIMAAIKNGTVDGRSMTHEEQVGMTLILFSGGLDTTKVAISDILLELARRPELEQVLRTPGWEKTTLDELIRFSSPVGALGRVVTRDAELGGQTLHPGDRVLVHYSSANHDDSQFDRPNDMIFDRERNPHVGFGLGIHRCIGIHLARAQVRIAIDEILASITNVRLADGGTLTRRPGISRVLDELRLEFDPR